MPIFFVLLQQEKTVSHESDYIIKLKLLAQKLFDTRSNQPDLSTLGGMTVVAWCEHEVCAVLIGVGGFCKNDREGN